MSRDISPELESAQKAPIRKYGWRVCVGDCLCEATRFDWGLIYQSGASQQFSAMVLGGTVYRARVSSTGYLEIDDVVDPLDDGEWSGQWRWSLGQVARNDSPVCITYLDRLASGLTPAVFYLRRADGDVVMRWLDPITMTWGAELLVYDVAGTESIRGLHLDPAGGSGRWLVALLDRGGVGGDEDPMVVEYDRAGDRWLAAVTMNWGHYEVEGVASVLDGDYVRFWFKGGSGGGHLYYGSYRTTDRVWSATAIMCAGENGFCNYRLTAGYDADWQRWFFVWRESCASPAINRHVISFSPVWNYLTERFPAPTTQTWPLQLLKVGGYWYLAGANVAYRGTAWTASSEQIVDLSSRVACLEEEYPGPNRPAKLTLLLDNSDGTLGAAGYWGTPFRPLREGSQVSIGLGVETAGRLEYAWRSPWYIERLTFEDERGEGYLRVECTDPLGVLHRLRSRAQPSWTGATAREVLWHVFYRVTSTQLAPAGALGTSMGWISIKPGTKWGELAEEVLRWAGVVVRWRTKALGLVDGLGPGAVDVAAIALEEGTPTRAFGGDGQPPIVAGSFETVRPQPVNHVQIFGDGSSFGEYWDSSHQSAQSRDLVEIVNDRKLTSAADCTTAAVQRIRWAQLGSEGGWVEVYPDFALEVGDLVTITYSRAYLFGKNYRIVGMRTVFDPRRGRYAQRLYLGAG